jgi:MurNAc alpha-1-phosphate uridylyltransferase
MKALVLAAGRGTRLRPWTDQIPKPLLKVGGQSLIVHQIQALAAAGFQDLVVNLSYRGDQIRSVLGDGRNWGVRIRYSDEGPEPLETAGGIRRALPWLGPAPFLVVNADLMTDFPYATLSNLEPDEAAQIVLVPNPGHHPEGDFTLTRGRAGTGDGPRLTFAGIGCYRAALFESMAADRPLPLAPWLRHWALEGVLGGRFYDGLWRDMGTPEAWRDAGFPLSGTSMAGWSDPSPSE